MARSGALVLILNKTGGKDIKKYDQLIKNPNEVVARMEGQKKKKEMKKWL